MKKQFVQNQYLTSCYELEDVFSPQECQKIIHSRGDSVDSTINSQELKLKKNISVRNSVSKYLSSTPQNMWIAERMVQIIDEVNKLYYHFRIQDIHGVQVIKYEPEGFYNWHMDLGRGENSTRKLSFIAFLSPTDNYSGGALKFSGVPQPIVQKQGKVVVFPSYIAHKVEPVTEGIRHSLVCWVYGPHFC